MQAPWPVWLRPKKEKSVPLLHKFNQSSLYVGLDMYRECKKTEFPKEYCIWIWNQQHQEVDQEIDGKMNWGRMEEAPETGKESSHSAHVNGMNELMNEWSVF
jgi:hypothetical protein